MVTISDLKDIVSKIIQPTLSKSTTMIKNSTSFIEQAKEWNVDKEEIQVSYDVVALYPSVPVQKAIENLMDMLQDDTSELKNRTIFEVKHIKKMVEACLYKAYFLWDDKTSSNETIAVLHRYSFLIYTLI